METEKTKDSNKIFIEKFCKDNETFIKWAIDETIFFDEQKDENFLKQWNYIKDALNIDESKLCTSPTLGKEYKVYIRKNGNNGKNSDSLKMVYNDIFPLAKIVVDTANNTSTYGKVNSIGLYRRWTSKIKEEESDKYIILKNYKVSHIFGCTANPYLFHAPWNICLTPNIVDPLTGHETSGELSEAFKKAFYETVFNKYQKYIEEYNDILANGVREKVRIGLIKAELFDIMQQWEFIKKENYIVKEEFPSGL